MDAEQLGSHAIFPIAPDDAQLESLCRPGDPSRGAASDVAARSAARWLVAGLGLIGALAVAACVVAGRSRGGLGSIPTGGQLPELTLVVPASQEARGHTCSWGLANCNETRCCNAPGLQCYRQNRNYAQCKASCVAQAADPRHWDGQWWECAELGPRSEGEPIVCSKAGEYCGKSQCCADPGFQCFEKNATFATCKKECSPDGPDLSDTDGKPWTCKQLGERSQPLGPWISQQCVASGQNCLKSMCCQAAGEQCYQQNEYWGVCKASCDPQADGGWACTELGVRTPTVPSASKQMSPWAFEQCSKPGEACLDSRCCLGMDMQCYEKTKYWATCKRSCTPGPDEYDGNATWSCRELGPRSFGNAIKGYPAVYCFAVFQTTGYEVDLLNAAREKEGGIFACDEYSLLTPDGTVEIRGEQSTKFQGAPIVTSVDGTAGNTRQFINAWNKVVEIGKWRNHAFTVKVDPDAVFLPQKLRWHLGEFVGKTMFVVNCPLWNMIYGALEIFSFGAMEKWAQQGNTCNSPDNFGEDKYMTQCMDHLQVSRVNDWGVVGDKLCGTFTDCSALPAAAFHPFKDTWGWVDCWQTAMDVYQR